MPKAFDQWTVHPHRPIEKVRDDLWRVEAPVPGAPIPRTMLLVRLADGRLVIHNAIALDDAEMAEIEAWGKPSFLIVPNGSHRLDSKIFKDRYPALRVITAPGSKAKVEEVVKVDDTAGDFGDGAVRYEVLDGTKEKEGVVVVDRGETTLIFNDAIMNMRSLPGFGGFMMGLFGFTGPKPKVSLATKMVLVADKKKLRSHLERLAATPRLARIEVGHGIPVTEGAADALRSAASTL
jgi:hypothetical protein